MGIIRVLDEHIANQIAAGEVVERPSSVVKELVENAIDAGANKIDVTVEEGGLASIRIKDNGSGIAEDDCEAAFYRHATSKISSGKDLFHIRSLGFRGEALPSIAAVSKLECLTSSRTDGLGRKIVIEGGVLKENTIGASGKGTEFIVRDLFYNTPARLKYMKTTQTELGSISDYIYRLALSHPDIAFTLRHNGNLLLQTVGNGDRLQVIAAIYGTSAAKSMLETAGENPDYKLSGFISRPEVTRSNRSAMTLVVNGRYIRNYALANAVMNAYHTLLPVHRFPIVVLDIAMTPALVDVNVHPAKLEVRFSKEAELVKFIEGELKQVLKAQLLIPEVTVNKSVNKTQVIQEQLKLYETDKTISETGSFVPTTLIEPILQNDDLESLAPKEPMKSNLGQDLDMTVQPMPVSADYTAETGVAMNVSGPSSSAKEMDTFSRNTDSANHQSDSRTAAPAPQSKNGDGGRDIAKSAGSRLPEPDSWSGKTANYTGGYNNTGRQAASPEYVRELYSAPAREQKPDIPALPKMFPIGQLHGTYIVAQNDSGMYLIDQHAAHERLNYEYYYEQFGNPKQASQELLVPIMLEFTPSESETLKSRLPFFEQAGVYVEHFGGQSFLVRAIPHWFPQGEETDILTEMAEWVLSEKKSIDLAKLREKAAILCSCKASIKANQNVSLVQLEALLDRLRLCGNPYTCPHGRPIVISFSTYELEKMFKRVM